MLGLKGTMLELVGVGSNHCDRMEYRCLLSNSYSLEAADNLSMHRSVQAARYISFINEIKFVCMNRTYLTP